MGLIAIADPTDAVSVTEVICCWPVREALPHLDETLEFWAYARVIPLLVGVQVTVEEAT